VRGRKETDNHKGCPYENIGMTPLVVSWPHKCGQFKL